jgi:hypothetical protein
MEKEIEKENNYQIDLLTEMVEYFSSVQELSNLKKATNNFLFAFNTLQGTFHKQKSQTNRVLFDIRRRAIQYRYVYDENEDLEDAQSTQNQEVCVRLALPYFGEPIKYRIDSANHYDFLALGLAYIKKGE